MKLKLLIITTFISAASSAQTTNLDTIESRMHYAAKQGLIDKYYPRNIDTLYGGYLSTFSYDIKPVGTQDKMIVTQARHIWSTAKAHRMSPCRGMDFIFCVIRCGIKNMAAFIIWLQEMARRKAL